MIDLTGLALQAFEFDLAPASRESPSGLIKKSNSIELRGTVLATFGLFDPQVHAIQGDLYGTSGGSIYATANLPGFGSDEFELEERTIKIAEVDPLSQIAPDFWAFRISGSTELSLGKKSASTSAGGVPFFESPTDLQRRAIPEALKAAAYTHGYSVLHGYHGLPVWEGRNSLTTAQMRAFLSAYLHDLEWGSGTFTTSSATSRFLAPPAFALENLDYDSWTLRWLIESRYAGRDEDGTAVIIPE